MFKLSQPKSHKLQTLNQTSREPKPNGEDSPKLLSNSQTHQLTVTKLPQKFATHSWLQTVTSNQNSMRENSSKLTVVTVTHKNKLTPKSYL